MAQSGYGARELAPSLLDRLMDERPDAAQETSSDRAQDLHAFTASVARDLENLLNTRRELLADLPAGFQEVSRALPAYGLPDFTAFNLMDVGDLARLRRAIETAIANFEPRLLRVQVNLEQPKENDRAVHFRIEGLLRVEPATEPVVFDTILQLGTQEYVVKGES